MTPRKFAVILLICVQYETCYCQLKSNLPIIVINTEGRRIRDESRISAWMGISFKESGELNSENGPFDHYEGRISIELRGNTSLDFPKKPYAFESQQADGSNLNVPFLGMPEENDWILYAPYSDKSLMRNTLIFQLTRDMGRYAPRTRFCELVINEDYQGIYVLMEKIKRDKNRVDIAKLTETDTEGDVLTGGYILKQDWPDNKSQGWHSRHDATIFHYHHPQKEDLLPVQQEYIRDWVLDFNEVIAGENYLHPTEGYRSRIDMGSFVDYFLGSEFAHNADSYSISTFMYKERDSEGGLLHMGPQWDFNLAFGNQDEGPYGTAEEWSWKIPLDDNSFWWRRLLSDSVFTNSVRSRWAELRQNLLSQQNIFATIDSMVLEVNEAKDRNFDRWPVLGEWVWPNAYVGDTYEDEVEYLKDFVTDRLQWMDENLPDLEVSGDPKDPEDPEDPSKPENTVDPQPGSSFEFAAYPCPFQESVHFRFTQKFGGQVSIQIFNVLGQHIHTLTDQWYKKGTHERIWAGKDKMGLAVPAGHYFVTIEREWEVVAKSKIVRY